MISFLKGVALDVTEKKCDNNKDTAPNLSKVIIAIIIIIIITVLI